MSEKQPAENPNWGGAGGSGEAPPPYPGPPPPAYPQHPKPPITGQPGTYVIPPQANVQGIPGQPQQVTVVVAPSAQLGPYPVHTQCPHCSAAIVTRVEYESGLLAWLLCGGLALFGCIYGCCLIPFCCDSAKNALHTCPNCSQFIGSYNRI